MSTIALPDLLNLFDITHPFEFTNGADTTIKRTYNATDNTAQIEKSYSKALGQIGRREIGLMSDIATAKHEQIEVTSRVVGMQAYFKLNSVHGGHKVLTKWYGFDIDDWTRLLQPPNTDDVHIMHRARWLLELTRSSLKALHLMHINEYLHCDVHAGNLCLPFTLDEPLSAGQNISCTVDPDALKLIDLGVSLRPSNERGNPPQLTGADGKPVGVINFNVKASPPQTPALLKAYRAADEGDNGYFKNLDWRVDIWRLGKLIECWISDANISETGLVGTVNQKAVLQDSAEQMQEVYNAIDQAMPHKALITAISSLIGEVQPLKASIACGSHNPSWRAKKQAPQPAAETLLTSAPAPKIEIIAPQIILPSHPAKIEAYPGGPVLVVLPRATDSQPGTLLGDANSEGAEEKPPYRVLMPYRLCIGETTITFAQWDEAVAANGCQAARDGNWSRTRGTDDREKANRPVTDVSWDEVQKYLKWLNAKSDLHPLSADSFRLPTEAEWEYACRAGSDAEFSLGRSNNLPLSNSTANYDSTVQYKNTRKGQARDQPVKVKTFEANAWGLYEMHGNVWEWCDDIYLKDAHKQKHRTDPWLANEKVRLNFFQRLGGADARALRGGSVGASPQRVTSASRISASRNSTNARTGFRIARTLSEGVRHEAR